MKLVVQIALPQVPAYQILRDSSPEFFAAVLARLEEDGGSGDDDVLWRALGEAGLVEQSHADLVAEVLLSLAGIRRELGVGAEDVASAIPSAPQLSYWSKSDRERWATDVAPGLARILDSAALRLLDEVTDLATDHQNVLTRARVVTDLRPVFDSDGHAKAAIVSHVLRVDFRSRRGPDGVAVALDAEDVEKLLLSCQEALIRGRAARAFAERAGAVAIDLGSRSDEEI
jgi:hypothetical protein